MFSDAWPAEAIADARAVPIWTRPIAPRFTAHPHGIPAGFSPWASDIADRDEGDRADPADDLDAARADAFSQGFEAGARAERDLLAQERGALTRLAATLNAFEPEPVADLAGLLTESVSRLVRQICGEVEPDPATMAGRIAAIAALVHEETGPARLRLHPRDAERLDGAGLTMPIVADPALAEGTILAETASGWIEDGAAIRLERLRTLLDAMGVGR